MHEAYHVSLTQSHRASPATQQQWR